MRLRPDKLCSNVRYCVVVQDSDVLVPKNNGLCYQRHALSDADTLDHSPRIETRVHRPNDGRHRILLYGFEVLPLTKIPVKLP